MISSEQRFFHRARTLEELRRSVRLQEELPPHPRLRLRDLVMQLDREDSSCREH